MSTGMSIRGVNLRKLLLVALIAVAVLAAVVLAARAFVGSTAGMDFLERYPGHSAPQHSEPSGASWWVQWSHALNFLMITLLIRSGWMVHSQRQPEAYWTSTRRRRSGGAPTKVSIYLWLHWIIDILWVAIGLIFAVLLFVTGEWRRIVPTSWDAIPNALSAGLQYLSLDWPVDDPWISYNALQVLAYFVTVFIAAPVAILTGLRMSPIWNSSWRVSKIYPVKIARTLHFPTMLYFAGFIVVHVTLVFTTGMRRNLNYMYANVDQTSVSWWGFAIFAVTLIVVAGAWTVARPMFLAPVASMTGRVSAR